ncbi:MAG: peptidylprolyl isomerase [Syntrophobacteraceae bacterium]
MKKTVLLASIFIVCVSLAGYGIYVSAAEKTAGKTTGKEAASSGKETPSPAKTEGAPVKGDSSGNVAKVNGKPITKADYQVEVDRFDRRVEMMGRAADDKEVGEMKKQILDNMIGREVLKQQAAGMGMKADEAEVNMQMEGLKKKFGSQEEFVKALAQMNLNEQTIRDQFASEMVLRKLIDQEVAAKIVLDPAEARGFYDKNPDIFKSPEMIRASHILVKVDAKASPEEKAKALEKMKGIEKKIKGGADFAQVAKEVSDCPSKENGGDLNFFERGQMVAPFEQAAFSIKPGQVSGIVETEFGYHLIKVTEKKDAGVMSFEEMRPRIEQHIKNEKVSQQLVVYVDKLKSAAKIEILVK